MGERAKLVIAITAGLACVVAVMLLPMGDYALQLVHYVRGAGALGVAVYALAYVVATVAFVPGSLLTMGAGFVWGVWGGAAIVWPASLAGATLAFAVGRFMARDWVRRRVQRSRGLTAIDQAVGADSFTIIMLLRLSPLVPFSLLNYALGVTGARTRHYVLASAVGMIPGMFLYVYLGSLLTGAAALVSGQRPDAGIGGQVLLYAGLGATVCATVYVSRRARRHLREALGSESTLDVTS